MCLHFFELKSDPFLSEVFFLPKIFTIIPFKLFLECFLEEFYVVNLIGNTFLISAFFIVDLTNTMRNPSLTFKFLSFLGNSEGTLISLKSLLKVVFLTLGRFFYVDFNEFLSDGLGHFHPLLGLLENTCLVKSIFQKINSLIFFILMVIALAKAQQSNKFRLFVLDNGQGTFSILARSITFE